MTERPTKTAYLYLTRRIRLNIRITLLACRRGFVTSKDIGASYDVLSGSYDNAWLIHLKSVTDRLLTMLTEAPAGIADLGCGTGYTTGYLAEKYHAARIYAIDVSRGMLDQARAKVSSGMVSFEEADMLAWLQGRPVASLDCIISAWAIGYSHPARLIREAGRVLKRHGTFAFVVNYRDTLEPVFNAFRRTMRRFPDSVTSVAVPRFPRDCSAVQTMMRKGGFAIREQIDGNHPVVVEVTGMERLDWLLKTGILAGFDTMLPLRDNSVVRNYFIEQLDRNTEPLAHHYTMVSGTKE